MLFFRVIATVLYVLLVSFDLCMLIRAICSWIPNFQSSKIYEFTYKITEPILSPVRNLLMRWDFVRRCPLDLSFLVVIILTSLIQRFLYIFM